MECALKATQRPFPWLAKRDVAKVLLQEPIERRPLKGLDDLPARVRVHVGVFHFPGLCPELPRERHADGGLYRPAVRRRVDHVRGPYPALLPAADIDDRQSE